MDKPATELRAGDIILPPHHPSERKPPTSAATVLSVRRVLDGSPNMPGPVVHLLYAHAAIGTTSLTVRPGRLIRVLE